MKIRFYVVYYNDEIDRIFLRKKKAEEYIEDLKISNFDINNNIFCRKEYIYV